MSEQSPSKLLLNLKVTVESLLECQLPDVWNLYGGFNRVCSALIDTLHHGLKLIDAKGQPDLWAFIEGLNWLQPSLHGCISPGPEVDHFPEFVKSNKALLWIYYHVENDTIAEKMSWLLSDREHLLNSYHEFAFLCHPKYADAMLVCLKALERNQLDMLSDVDPGLYVLPVSTSGFAKTHRRCSSFPQTQVIRAKSQDIEMPVFAGSLRALDRTRVVTGMGVLHGSIPKQGHWPGKKEEKLKRSQSLPTVLTGLDVEPIRLRSKTIVPKISPKVDYRKLRHQRKCRKKRERAQRTFIEDGGSSVRPAATGYFPRPAQGQSLTSFFAEAPFTSAELDRENAHFRICESLISAIEQVKCNRVSETGSEDGSNLPRPGGSGATAERRRFRRRRIRTFAGRAPSGWGDTTTASEQTPTPPSSSQDDSSDDSIGSYAERLALSLLSQFEETQLPKASELEWLVAPEDTPQDLLPLPGTFVGGSKETFSTPLRGTIDWAPPRPQLILTVHETPRKKFLLAKQNLRCAGCGCTVAPAYASRFRYCEYIGRYFCTGCHSNQMALIPARVIQNWDFKRYAVSTFSYRLLEQMTTDPLFRIDDLNPKLYKKVKSLDQTRAFRLQLHFLNDFLFTCRFAEHLKDLVAHLPPYMLIEPDRFSLRDLCRVRTGELPVDLQALVKTGRAHVDTCVLCQARGFLCELCNCKEVIFPWVLEEVSRCQLCGACFHAKCFVGKCPRCIRLAARKLSKKS